MFYQDTVLYYVKSKCVDKFGKPNNNIVNELDESSEPTLHAFCYQFHVPR